jgi:hypothetical protein
MSNRFPIHIYSSENWICWRKAVLCLGEYGNCISRHGHSVVTLLNSAIHDHTTNIIHKSLQSWYYVSSYQIIYMSTCDDHSALLVSNPHTHIMTVCILKDDSINPTLAQHPPQTTHHIITHYSELACWGWFCVGWWYHFYCWVLEWYIIFLQQMTNMRYVVVRDNDAVCASDDCVLQQTWLLSWSVSILRIHIFWDIIVCCLLSGFWHLKALMHYVH